jgi:hypothetical protein
MKQFQGKNYNHKPRDPIKVDVCLEILSLIAGSKVTDVASIPTMTYAETMSAGVATGLGTSTFSVAPVTADGCGNINTTTNYYYYMVLGGRALN